MQCQPSPCSGPVLVPHHGGRGRPGRLLRRGRGQRGDRAGAARGHLPGAVQTVHYSTVRAVQYSTVQLFRLIAIYPYSSHQEDGARFCFCGKKGAAETTNWKFICGT